MRTGGASHRHDEERGESLKQGRVEDRRHLRRLAMPAVSQARPPGQRDSCLGSVACSDASKAQPRRRGRALDGNSHSRPCPSLCRSCRGPSVAARGFCGCAAAHIRHFTRLVLVHVISRQAAGSRRSNACAHAYTQRATVLVKAMTGGFDSQATPAG